MLVDVRFGRSRCFSAPRRRSASLPSSHRSCCSSTPPPPSPALPRAAGRSIRPAVWSSRSFVALHDSLCGCGYSLGQGRRRRERAGSSCTRSRHEKDDDKERQEEGGDGAYQHHLKFNLDKIDDYARRSTCIRRCVGRHGWCSLAPSTRSSCPWLSSLLAQLPD